MLLDAEKASILDGDVVHDVAVREAHAHGAEEVVHVGEDLLVIARVRGQGLPDQRGEVLVIGDMLENSDDPASGLLKDPFRREIGEGPGNALRPVVVLLHEQDVKRHEQRVVVAPEVPR